MIGQACNCRCWFAKKEECNCSCGGANHQIGTQEFLEGIKDEEDLEKINSYLGELKENYQVFKKLRKKERRMRRKGLEVVETSPLSFLPKRTKKLEKLIQRTRKVVQ